MVSLSLIFLLNKKEGQLSDGKIFFYNYYIIYENYSLII
jgi:hypothetical protein